MYLTKGKNITEHTDGSINSSQNQEYEDRDEELEVDFFVNISVKQIFDI